MPWYSKLLARQKHLLVSQQCYFFWLNLGFRGRVKKRMRWMSSLLLLSLLVAFPGNEQVFAQSNESDEDMEFEPDDVSSQPAPSSDSGPEPEEPDVGSLTSEDSPTATQPIKADPKLTDSRQSWKDIVVVVRKPFLKTHRFEILPQLGITMNDNLVRHFQLAGQLNYYLTDALAVGIEGQLFRKDLREPFDLIARQARRLPSVNEYKYGAAVNFHYVPVYGKFVIFNRIIHWESFFTAGAGITRTKVIPRDPKFAPFSNMLITPNVGVSMRFFITKFLTVHVGIRDYIFIDKLEPAGRTRTNLSTASEAKSEADSVFINNIMFQTGISIWFPMSFEYSTFR